MILGNLKINIRSISVSITSKYFQNFTIANSLIRAGIILFFWFLLLLSVFYSGHLYSNDASTKIESARNFYSHGSFAINEQGGAWGIRGRDGNVYPHFSLGSIMAMIPPFALYKLSCTLLNKKLPKFALSVLATFCNLLCTAGIGVLLYVFFLEMGTIKYKAFLYAHIIIFTSEMLQYSSTAWSEPAAFFWGMLGIVLLINKSYNESFIYRKWVLWAICAFIASLIRIEYITFFIAFLFVSMVQDRKHIKKYFFPGMIVLSVFLLHMWFNYYRFKNIFDFGCFSQMDGEGKVSLSNSFLYSLRSLSARFTSWTHIKNIVIIYFSFGRIHWFWVCPLLAIVPFTFKSKTKPKIVKDLFIGACITQIMIIAMGGNSWCWGNRYLYTTFVYLLLPVFFLSNTTSKFKFVFVTLSWAGLIIAFMSTLVNYHFVQELLVKTDGCYKTMVENNLYIAHAPIWTHIILFPKLFINTCVLFIQGEQFQLYDQIRESCLDIWPVSMCRAGINSYLAFGLWFMTIGSTICYWKYIVSTRFTYRQRINRI